MNWWGANWSQSNWWSENWFSGQNDTPTSQFDIPLYYDFTLLGAAAIVSAATPSVHGGEYIIIYRRRRRE